MSTLVVGLSHKSAPLTLLERALVSGDGLAKLLRDLWAAEHVAGVFVISTYDTDYLLVKGAVFERAATIIGARFTLER